MKVRSLRKPEILGPPHPVDGGDYAPIAVVNNLANAKLIFNSVNRVPIMQAEIDRLKDVIREAIVGLRGFALDRKPIADKLQAALEVKP